MGHEMETKQSYLEDFENYWNTTSIHKLAVNGDMVAVMELAFKEVAKNAWFAHQVHVKVQIGALERYEPKVVLPRHDEDDPEAEMKLTADGRYVLLNKVKATVLLDNGGI